MKKRQRVKTSKQARDLAIDNIRYLLYPMMRKELSAKHGMDFWGNK